MMVEEITAKLMRAGYQVKALHRMRRGDRQSDSDYPAGEAGRGGFGGSVLARVTTFRRLFFAEQRRPAQTLALLAFFWCRSRWACGFALRCPTSWPPTSPLKRLFSLTAGWSEWAMLGGAVLSGGRLPP